MWRFLQVKALEYFNVDHHPTLRKGVARSPGDERLHRKGRRCRLARAVRGRQDPPGDPLGFKAIDAGYAVQVDTAVGWFARLQATHAENCLEAGCASFDATSCSFIDGVGYIPFDSDAATLFFWLVAHRYGQGSSLVISNMLFGRWGEVFADDIVAAATIDRPSTTRGPHPRRPAPPDLREDETS